MKICSRFAVFRPRTKHFISIDGIFYARLTAVFVKILGCPYPRCCHRNMLAFLVEQRDWAAFSLSTYKIFISKMTKNNENVVRANNSSTENTFTHETGTFLTADNIERIKNLFSTPENYAKNLGALWVFRDLLYMTIERDQNPRENQLFALWQTINEVVGSLIRQDVHFDENGRAYYYQGTVKMFI